MDVLITGGQLVDGSGNPWHHADVAINGDRIAAVAPPGRLAVEQARQVVDAAGMVVCPGFIDIHSHSIAPLMVDGRSLSKITQGVTTEIMGEWWTPAPFGGRCAQPIPPLFRSAAAPAPEWDARIRTWRRFRDWPEAMVARGVSPNIGSFLGGGTVREYARGMDSGRSSSDDLATMRRVAHEAMADGAFGVAYALIYPPNAFADTDEIVAVCGAVAAHGGLYVTHMRSEGDQLFEALEETFAIGRRAQVPVEIYHLKAAGQRNWAKMPEVIRRIDQARAAGLDVTAGMYPYVASGTGLSAVLPPWVAAGGRFLENLCDPALRGRIRQAVLDPSGDSVRGIAARPESVLPLRFAQPHNQHYVGKRLSEISAARGQDWIDAAIDLLVDEGQDIFTIYFLISEENVRLQLRQPWMKIASDAGGIDPAWATALGPTHPRAYGTYPQVLGTYVRDEGVISLEEAVRKMTSAVAHRLGLPDRGTLRPGAFADVVVFDPATMRALATYEEPHQLSTGVRHVWINGQAVLVDGTHTGALPGHYVTSHG